MSSQRTTHSASSKIFEIFAIGNNLILPRFMKQNKSKQKDKKKKKNQFSICWMHFASQKHSYPRNFSYFVTLKAKDVFWDEVPYQFCASRVGTLCSFFIFMNMLQSKQLHCVSGCTAQGCCPAGIRTSFSVSSLMQSLTASKGFYQDCSLFSSIRFLNSSN